MDEFSFSETKYINSHIDYETYIKEKIHYQKTYILPDDKLSVYRDVIDRGIFNFSDGKTHHVEIILEDANSNRSVLVFNVKDHEAVSKPSVKESDKSIIVMPYNRANRFRAENISVTIPAGALYDSIEFTYDKKTGNPQMYSDIHYVHSIYTPVHKPFSLSIKPSVIPEGKESKLLIIQLQDNNRKNALNSRLTDGYVTTDASSFGVFYVGIDTIAPVISANGISSGADLTGKKEFRIRITDELSGIKSYNTLIDDIWALFEYDQKNSVLIYKFDPKRIAKDADHSLELEVTDNRDNKSRFSCNFRW